eukprot:CAMPEP_0196781900 /NCGR_PEP_ID=MMETSP1104-20130614/10429_1 /TAXON_ID=33652 /ORGANISM="Cafeteria sp., Strain Caron Lab Isolate" /LENGTH=213 /DNA_ID=CAMNT_0042152131 /DNA_START=8 /DNA_END=649 /DNA_ORIENTATION=+
MAISLESPTVARFARFAVPTVTFLCFIFMLVTSAGTAFETECNFGGTVEGSSSLWRSCVKQSIIPGEQCSKIKKSDYDGMRGDTWTALQFARAFVILSLMALLAVLVYTSLAIVRPAMAELVPLRVRTMAIAATVFLELVAMASVSRWTDNVRSDASSSPCSDFTFTAGGGLVCIILAFLLSAFVLLPAHFITSRKPSGDIADGPADHAYGSV